MPRHASQLLKRTGRTWPSGPAGCRICARSRSYKPSTPQVHRPALDIRIPSHTRCESRSTSDPGRCNKRKHHAGPGPSSARRQFARHPPPPRPASLVRLDVDSDSTDLLSSDDLRNPWGSKPNPIHLLQALRCAESATRSGQTRRPMRLQSSTHWNSSRSWGAATRCRLRG